jgi:L-amino acid N-acyltransferase YncA
MPYEIKRAGSGYVVVTKGTGKAHLKKALQKARALAQMRELYANIKPGER